MAFFLTRFAGRAAELAGISRVEFLLSLGRFKVSPFEAELEDLEREIGGHARSHQRYLSPALPASDRQTGVAPSVVRPDMDPQRFQPGAGA